MHFPCPACECPSTAIADEPWSCRACDLQRTFTHDPALTHCPICQSRDIYKKKDFPHWLGLSILTVASIGFLLGHYFYLPRLAWTILIGSALIDGGLYLWVRDVLVCYGCGAHLRGVTPLDHHLPFDLGTAERYRQERIRRQTVAAGDGNETPR